MDVKIEKKSETKREVEVIISNKEMEEYIEIAVKNLSNEVKIKGFRSGHAPRNVIENEIGKEKIYEEAAHEAVQATYPKIIEENNLFTISAPHVEIIKCAPGNEVIYKALVYVMPEINLPNYKKIAEETVKKEKKEIKVDEKEILNTIENVREAKAVTTKVERGAKKGDVVVFDFKGIFQENKEKKIEEKGFRITIGNGEVDLLEGLEDNLLEMKEGDKKSFSLFVPKLNNSNEKEKDFSGKIDFEVEMKSVMEKELPEINDEFAKSFPNIESLKQLKEKIEEGIKREKEIAEKETLRIKVLENIKKKTSFEVPEVMTEKELENMIKVIENQLAQNGSSLDDYLEKIKKSEDDLKKEWRGKAEENVAYALILHTVSKDEKIEVTKEEIESEVDHHFQSLNKKKEDEKEENLQRMRAYINDVIKNRKVFKALSIEE